MDGMPTFGRKARIYQQKLDFLWN